MKFEEIERIEKETILVCLRHRDIHPSATLNGF